MKKQLITILSVLALLVTASVFTGCADANGLHNQQALDLTIQFKNFGSISGDYAVPGNFTGDADWERQNGNVDVTMKNGEGTAATLTVTRANIQFTLVPVDSWVRGWYVENQCYGNGVDSGNYCNFYIDDLDLSAGEATIVVDASKGTVTLQ